MFRFQSPSLKGISVKLHQLSDITPQLVDDFKKKEAKLLLDKIRHHIRSQDIKWKPLSEGYKLFKLQNDLNPGIWIATGELLKELKVQVDSSGRYYVGADPGKVHKGTGVNINRLIQYLEYGTRHMPARAVFEPSKMEMHADIKSRVNAYITAGIKKQMKS